MNWDQMEGRWTQMKGQIRQKWAKLTDDDLEYMSGSRDRFVGRLQERYGIAKEDAQRQAEEWMSSQESNQRLNEKTRTGGSGSL